MGSCLSFTCSLVAFLQLRLRRNLSFFHFWEHLRLCSWGSASGRSVLYYRPSLVSFASVSKVGSGAGYCFSQRLLTFSYAETISCRDYQTRHHFHHCSFNSTAHSHPPNSSNRELLSGIPCSIFSCYSINRFVGCCNSYLDVSCTALDFVG